MQRLDALLLTAIGVLLVHQVAYTVSALAGSETSVAHGHMAFAWFGGSLAILCVLARSITSSLKRRNHAAGSIIGLTGWIVGGYVILEQFERAIDGYGTFSLFAEPVFWLGLAVALPIAIGLHWSVRSVARAVLAFIVVRGHDWPTPIVKPCPAAGFVTPVPVRLASVVSRRGPPENLFT